MAIKIRALISKIDKALFDCRDEHPHQHLIKKSLKGPIWSKVPEYEDCFLVYQIKRRNGRIGYIRAIYGDTLKRIIKEFYREIQAQGTENVDILIPVCNALLRRKRHEYREMAFDWCFRMKRDFEPRHFRTLEYWVKNYLTTWYSVDDLGTHSLGYFLYTYPQFAPRVKAWLKSRNPWIRRAAAVTFIYGLRRGVFIKDILEVADALLADEHKYVQWGYGWMLKEATRYYQDRVFEYVLRNKAAMPRSALRYAVEKMPRRRQRRAMAK